jgi:hypothetical protein
MLRFNVKCGELKAVVMAPTAFKAAIESMEFASGKKLDHKFFVREITVQDGEVTQDAGRISYSFEKVAKAAGWVVE